MPMRKITNIRFGAKTDAQAGGKQAGCIEREVAQK